MTICQIFLVILSVVALKYSGGLIDPQASQKETSRRLKRQVDTLTEDPNSLIYKFYYRVDDEDGNMHFRGEQKNKPNVVRGCYGYTDNKGLYRIVEYIADEGGFRAKILSNEPGIHRQNPADVQMGVYTPLSGIGFSYVHPCVDAGTAQVPENPSTLPVPTESPTTLPEPTENPSMLPEPTEYPKLPEPPDFPEYPKIPYDSDFPGYPKIPYDPEYPEYPGLTERPELPFGWPRREDGRGSAEGFGKNERPGEDKFDEKDQEVFEVPCFCAVGGEEVENAVEDGKELREIKTFKTERGISVARVDKTLGSRFDSSPSEIVLMGECSCRFVYAETLDEGVDRSVVNLRKDKKKKK